MRKQLRGLLGLLFAQICVLVPMPDSRALARRGVSDLTADGLPNIQSSSALVVDMQSGAVLYERDADVVRPIASISKLVGALVIKEDCKLDPETLHQMTSQNRDAAKGGDRSKLTTRWSYSLKDLMHAALMRSDNRALPALGDACGMTPHEFAEKMTKRVRRLGLNKTFFREPNGLSPENVSTPREVMGFLREVVRYPELAAILATQEYEITAYKDSRRRIIPIRNTDRLLNKDLATIIGGKTGYTDLARYCFAVMARMKDDRELGMVFLGGEGKHTRFADFTRVVHWLYPSQDARMLAAKANRRRLAKTTKLVEPPSSNPTPNLGITALDRANSPTFGQPVGHRRAPIDLEPPQVDLGERAAPNL